MSRTIFIGDVHGCIEELQHLIATVKPDATAGDRVIFVGDLVDKGPESLRALRFARWITEDWPGSVVVAGNHEEKALRFQKSGKLDKLKDQSWVHDAEEADWAFIEAMPLTWHDPELNVRVVHGGIFPALLQKHPDAFERIGARGLNWHKGGGKVMDRSRRMLRVRYVGGPQRDEKMQGDMLSLGANVEGDPFWAETYNGSQGFVIYGHSPWLDGKIVWADRAAGIDTACVFGAKLTALVLDPDGSVCVRPGLAPTIGGVPYSVVSVDAKKQYAKPLEGVD